MRVAAEERNDRAQRAGGAAVLVADARPNDRFAGADAGQATAMLARRYVDRGTAGPAARVDLDVTSVHVADAESVECAHRIKRMVTELHQMLRIAVRERIRAADAVAVGLKNN